MDIEKKRNATGVLVVVSGPSGVGKSTIVHGVRDRLDMDFSVSATTRKPREGEVDGRDYCFVDRKRFSEMADAGELLEWADVFGNCYGTPALPVRKAMEAGRTILLEIDVQGGLQVHRKMPDAVFILIVPPSEAVLVRRLSGRGSEDAAAMERRLAKAKLELQTAILSGAYNHQVVNGDLETAVRRVVEIIKQESKRK